jgi:small subunit ribosomal protein S8
MSMNDTTAAALSKIFNSEKLGREYCMVKSSSLMKRILTVLQNNNYTGEFEEINDGKGNILKVNLLGNINKCGVIKPRFAIKKNGYEKFEKRFLPAKDFGLLIISTSKGIMTHTDAKTQKIGGKLLAYCY